MKEVSDRDVVRFWAKVSKGDGCWLWTAAVGTDGYGMFGFGGGSRHVSTHRFSWRLAHGEAPPGMDVCHSCDVRLCVNPAHLFLGTRRDNMRDAQQKGRLVHTPEARAQQRARSRRGEKHAQAVLTDAQVCAIREEYARGRAAAPGGRRRVSAVTQRELAERYGVTDAYISALVKDQKRVEVVVVPSRSLNAKLDPKDVCAIRARYDRRAERLIDIGADYGLTKSQVSAIGRRRAWKCVPEDVPLPDLVAAGVASLTT